jgi:hypothetical protein
MATQQIPRDDWPDFFDKFSRTHQGRTGTAELYGQGIPGNSMEANDLVFEGITYEEKGSDAHSVRVMLGKLTHEIPSPTQVWTRPSGDAGGEMIEVHGGDEHRLILKLHKSG